MNELKWRLVDSSKVRVFSLDEVPEIIYLIKLSNEYMIVHDDAYGLVTGKTEILSKDMLKDKYGIDVSEYFKSIGVGA